MGLIELGIIGLGIVVVAVIVITAAVLARGPKPGSAGIQPMPPMVPAAALQCPTCGVYLAGPAPFCSGCGNRLPNPAQPGAWAPPGGPQGGPPQR